MVVVLSAVVVGRDLSKHADFCASISPMSSGGLFVSFPIVLSEFSYSLLSVVFLPGLIDLRRSDTSLPLATLAWSYGLGACFSS